MNAMNGIAGSIVRTYTRQVQAAPEQQALHESAGARHQGGRPRTDSVSLSRTTQELMHLRQAAEGAPDVRFDKVMALKQAVRSGDYGVDPAVLAAKMLR